MKYTDLISRLRDGTKLPVLAALMNEAADAIEELTSDVREVKRGKWVFDNPLTADFMCDNCLERQIICTPFCPNCGADMRGEP